jgi:hypothetical protein
MLQCQFGSTRKAGILNIRAPAHLLGWRLCLLRLRMSVFCSVWLHTVNLRADAAGCSQEDCHQSTVFQESTSRGQSDQDVHRCKCKDAFAVLDTKSAFSVVCGELICSANVSSPRTPNKVSTSKQPSPPIFESKKVRNYAPLFLFGTGIEHIFN